MTLRSIFPAPAASKESAPATDSPNHLHLLTRIVLSKDSDFPCQVILSYKDTLR